MAYRSIVKVVTPRTHDMSSFDCGRGPHFMNKQATKSSLISDMRVNKIHQEQGT